MPINIHLPSQIIRHTKLGRMLKNKRNNTNPASWQFLLAAIIPAILITLNFGLFNSKYQSDVAFIKDEFEGLHEVHTYYEMQLELERIRGYRYGYLITKDKSLLAKVKKSSAKLEERIQASLSEPHSKQFNLHDKLTAWRNSIRKLEREFKPTNDPLDVFIKYTDAIKQIKELIIVAADQSNLTLDGQLESYYLMDITITRIPYITELLAKTRGLVTPLVGNNRRYPKIINRAQNDIVLLRHELENLKVSVGKANSAYFHGQRNSLHSFEKNYTGIITILKLAENVISGKNVSISSEQYWRMSDTQIESLHVFHEAVINELGQLLLHRIDKLKQQQFHGQLGFVLALLAVTFGFSVFYRANRRSFEEILKTQQELQISETYQRTVIETAADGIIIIDEQGLVESFNPAAEKIFMYAADEIIGKNVNMLMPEPYSSEHDGYLDNYHKTSKKKIIGIGREVEGLRKDGSVFPLDLAVSEVKVAGKGRRYTGIVRDITERKEVDKMKNEFVSTVSHELRTPLTSIRGSLDLLLGGVHGELSEQAYEFIKIANNNTERLLLLINDILDMQKIESGKMAFHFGRIDLNTLLADAIRDNAAYAKQYGVHFKVVRTVENAALFADPDRIIQVLNNLLSNACKFSPKESFVELSAARNNGILRVSVTDYGTGIPEEFQASLFDKFTQADGSDARAKGGTGLGLAISRLIIEKHGGKMGFNTKVGLGTTMYFDLPELTSDLKLVGGAILNANVASASSILIIEDDEDVAALLSRMLSESGYNSDIAYSAKEARNLLRENKDKYKAITLDILLPDENGIELITELRSRDIYSNIPVVVVSCVANETRRSLDGGALDIVGWMPKPFDAAKLIQMVRKAAKPGEPPHILHVEDDEDIHRIVNEVLKDYFNISWCSTLEASVEALNDNSFDLVLLDVGLPDGSGLDLLEVIEKRVVPPRVVIFSAADIPDEEAKKVKSVLAKANTSNDDLVKIITDSIK